MQSSLGFFSQYFRYTSLLNKYSEGRLIPVILFYFLVAILDGFGITMLMPLLESFGTRGEDTDTGFFMNFLSDIGLFDINQGILLFILAAIFIVKGVLKYLAEWLSANVGKTLAIGLRMKVLKGYRDLDFKFFTTKESGHFTNILGNQISRIVSFFNQFSKFNAQLGNALIYMLLAFILDWETSMMVALGGGFSVALLHRLANRIKQISLKRTTEDSHLNNLLIQVIAGFKYLKSTNSFEPIVDKIETVVKEIGSKDMRIRLMSGVAQVSYEPIVVILIISIIYLKLGILGGSIAALLVILMLFYRTMNMVLLAQSYWHYSMEYSGSLEVVKEELNQVDRESEEVGQAGNKLDFKKEIRLTDLTLKIEDKTILDEISVTIPKNSMVAFIGVSGSGKSSLINIITGLYKSKSGTCKIDDHPISEIDLMLWREKIGYVAQESVLFNDTIYNNISLWKKNDAKVYEASEMAFCDEFVRELNIGYDSLVGENGIKLSGGQRQRLTIARELFKNPEVLIFDEATSALDSESEKYVQEGVDNLKGKITLIIVSHRLSTVLKADKIYVLDKGRIVEAGTFEELFRKRSSRLYQMAKLQGISL